MGMSINSKVSGFRKWAEIHQPEEIDKVRTGANKSAVPEADDDQAAKTTDLQPHRPWLVPGTGKL